MLVTIGLEDYFHVGAFGAVIREARWGGFTPRIRQSTQRTLALLDRFGVRATFFVMGQVADHFPDLVRHVADQGHEIASQGYYHRTMAYFSSREAFREDLLASRDAVERAAGRKVVGHRVPHFLRPDQLWVLDELADAGYRYDSSIRPLGRRFADRRHIHPHGDTGLIEVPISTLGVAGASLPVAAGNGVRQLPPSVVERTVEWWFGETGHPFVTYFHVWELDPGQPRMSGPSRLARIRQYRNLDKMAERLAHYLDRYDCVSVADHLGLEQERVEPPTPVEVSSEGSADPARARLGSSSEGRLPVTVVVPCYNEAQTLGFLRNNLARVAKVLAPNYELHFVFVDDGSTDGTAEMLEDMFAGESAVRVLRHKVNQGVAAAIMTGLRAADTEVVASMDCDCTYDPVALAEMIPRLEPGVSMVTASPYHADGEVVGVPDWRLVLSRGASALYQTVLGEDLATFTSCFRVYRRSALVPLSLRESGFLGVAEMLGRLVLDGQRVVEHPATLEVRVFGHSKMKTLRTIRGHLGLLARFAVLRGTRPAPDPPP